MKLRGRRDGKISAVPCGTRLLVANDTQDFRPGLYIDAPLGLNRRPFGAKIRTLYLMTRPRAKYQIPRGLKNAHNRQIHIPTFGGPNSEVPARNYMRPNVGHPLRPPRRGYGTEVPA